MIYRIQETDDLFILPHEFPLKDWDLYVSLVDVSQKRRDTGIRGRDFVSSRRHNGPRDIVLYSTRWRYPAMDAVVSTSAKVRRKLCRTAKET
jgi:hypothetical protein